MNTKLLLSMGIWILQTSLFSVFSQNGVTQCGVDTGQPVFPVDEYIELQDPELPDASAWKPVNGVKALWGSSDRRYAMHRVPSGELTGSMALTAWKGEAVSAQAVVWTSDSVKSLSYELVNQSRGKQHLDGKDFQVGFVRYVMTDELNKGGGGCGYRPDHREYDSTLVADVIDSKALELPMQPQSVRGLWVKCNVPTDATPDSYRFALKIKADGKIVKVLPLTVKVIDRELPLSSLQNFHLDLWQNPFSVARYYQVPLWSDAHLEAMRPLMRRLAKAGQKVITASIMHKPWNGQTEDYYESMVTWTRKLDGSWTFDYAVFDRWVQFMMDCGIDKQINCYSMIPWALSFQYFDQATNRMQFIKSAPGQKEYEEVWVAMLRSFAEHLKQKGWFDICRIAMDERPMEDMLKTIEVIKKAEPDFQIAMAGNYHEEIESQIADYCIAIGQKFPTEVLTRRKNEGKKSTYYTCCTESHPNTFTFSDPSEAVWLGFYCAKDGVDGYLRWAYNSWVKEPLLDSRFSAWAAGDTYLVYPGDRSSVRLEKLFEGIQAYMKIETLRKVFREKNQKAAEKKLEHMLQSFELKDFSTTTYSAQKQTVMACKLLNTL